MKILPLLVIVVVFLGGCASDTSQLTKDIKTAQATAATNTAAIKAIQADFATLKAENTTLKTQVAALQTQTGKFATKDEVNAAFNNSAIPREWIDVKSQVNGFAGQVTMLKSRQDTSEANTKSVLAAQDTKIDSYLNGLSANYGSQYLYTLDQIKALQEWVNVLKVKVGM